jgi:HemY protein
MRLGLLILISLLLGALAAATFLDDTGYVLVQFQGWTLETSFAASVGALLVISLALYYSLRLLVGVVRIPRRLVSYHHDHQRRRGQKLLTRGLSEIAEGRWAEGERKLARGAASSEMPLINYLGAAVAAQFQGAYNRRDKWLQSAHEEQPDSSAAVLLTQAQLQFAHGQYEQALATLRQLEDSNPDHAYALILLAKLYHQLGDWRALAELLPKLRRVRTVPKAQLRQMERDTVAALFTACADARDTEQQWKSLPRDVREDPVVVGAYARTLDAQGAAPLGEKALRRLLAHDESGDIALIYSGLEVNLQAQLDNVERRLIEHQDEPKLQLAAARLCEKLKLWGKARSHLEHSIALLPSAEAYADLARLLEEMGEHDAAQAAYRNGLDRALKRDAEGDRRRLPRPD